LNRISFCEFRSFSDLFKDYTENFESLSPYFSGDFRKEEDLIDACRRVAQDRPDRTRLASVLRKQANAFGIAEQSEPLIRKLSQPESIAVVTGQQLGLFGGPLYTLLKSISAIQLAERLEELSGQPAVAVFWLEGEDHDFEEVASSGFLTGSGTAKVSYTPDDPAASETAIGRLSLTQDIIASVDDLEQLLPPTDFRDDLMSVVRSAYAPGRSMLEAFVTLVEHLLEPGKILFISPDDDQLKEMAAPLFDKELTDYSTSSSLLSAQSALLEEKYHAQVKTNPTNLFVHGDDRRTALDAVDDGFRTRDGQDVTLEKLQMLLADSPGSFSPNVVMRPLMQDYLLPTAAYIAGPGEVAYFAQFKGLYEWAGIQMPIIYPRASCTLLEKRISKIILRDELHIPDFEEQFEKVFRNVVLATMDTSLEDEFKKASTGLHQAINTIKPVIENVDRSLVKSADALRATFMKEWSRLQDRVLKSEKAQHETLKTQLEKVATALFPSGIPQERFVSPLYFLNKYGPDFGSTLFEQIDLDTTTHQIIEI